MMYRAVSIIGNVTLILISCLVSLFAAEGILRLAVYPVDYLLVETVSDPFLNHRIATYDGGHDAWGFRNDIVPNHADILAIGDSMTYGVMALSTESWPAHLEKMTGRSVYSAALGGYGPLHYLHILREKALELAPELVIVGLYLGNDFLDAYNLAYSNENWAAYRREKNQDKVDPALFLPVPGPQKLLGGLRDWLAKRSILYRMITQNPIFTGVRTRERKRLAPSSFLIDYGGNPVLLDPDRTYRFVNSDDPRIAEALEIVKRALGEIRGFCAKRGIALRVAIVPVKESVYFPLTASKLNSDQRTRMQNLETNLEILRASLAEFLTVENIPFTDLQPVFEDALKNGPPIYPIEDGHPNGRGYAIIAQSLAAAIKAHE